MKLIICKPFPLAVLKVIVLRPVSDCSEATAYIFLRHVSTGGARERMGVYGGVWECKKAY